MEESPLFPEITLSRELILNRTFQDYGRRRQAASGIQFFRLIIKAREGNVKFCFGPGFAILLLVEF
jgi:hypothetical protein